jgi:prevent-host-death family protein
LRARQKLCNEISLMLALTCATRSLFETIFYRISIIVNLVFHLSKFGVLQADCSVSRSAFQDDIHSLSEFRANASGFISQVHTTKRPLVITQNGKSAAVLLDVDEYEKIIDKAGKLQDHLRPNFGANCRSNNSSFQTDSSNRRDNALTFTITIIALNSAPMK